ncbi:MAG: hypothetical protein R2764_22700 [Bacteroidales bacterium]
MVSGNAVFVVAQTVFSPPPVMFSIVAAFLSIVLFFDALIKVAVAIAAAG